MTTLAINDLEINQELDIKAMQNITGGLWAYKKSYPHSLTLNRKKKKDLRKFEIYKPKPPKRDPWVIGPPLY